VYHWNRERLSELLGQTWRYGLGAGKFCNKHPDSPVTKKYHRYDLYFAGFLCLFLLILIGSLRVPQMLLIALLTVVVPLTVSSLYYFKQAFKRGAWSIPVLYPILDFLRASAFCSAQMYSELLERLRRSH
jgi:hypothetical protein